MISFVDPIQVYFSLDCIESEKNSKKGFVPFTDKINGQTKFVLSNVIELSLRIRYSELCVLAIESVLIKKISRLG